MGSGPGSEAPEKEKKNAYLGKKTIFALIFLQAYVKNIRDFQYKKH